MADYKVIIYVGLPGSGKDYAANQLIFNDPKRYKRINKDDLRSMIHNGHWSPGTEKHIIAARDALINSFMEHKVQNILITDTNLHPSHIKRIRDLVHTHNISSDNKYKIEIQDFTGIAPELCIERDLHRDRTVGSQVIWKMYYDFIFKPEVPEFIPNAPDAYIFDMDGTLALLGDRGPYEGEKCDLDPVNEPVAAMARALKIQGYHIIVMSGREEDICYGLTRNWLKDHKIPFDDLLMRPEGDKRPDEIVKFELYEKYLKGNVNIKAVFDDRQKVKRMWVKLGFFVFDCNLGGIEF